MSKLLVRGSKGLRRILSRRSADVMELVSEHGLTQSEARSWLDSEPSYKPIMPKGNSTPNSQLPLEVKNDQQSFLTKHSKLITQVLFCIVLTSLLLIASGLYLVTRTTNATFTMQSLIDSDNPGSILLPSIIPEGSTVTLSKPLQNTVVGILPLDTWRTLRDTATLTTRNILRQTTMPFRADSPVFTFNVANINRYVACVMTNSSIPLTTKNTFAVSIYPDRASGNVMWLSGGALLLGVRATLGLAGVKRIVNFYYHKVWKSLPK